MMDDTPRPVRKLPDCKIIFCDKKGCGCHYTDRCPEHGPFLEDEAPAPTTDRWPPNWI